MAIRKKKKNILLHRSEFEDVVIEGLNLAKINHTYESVVLKYEIPATPHKYTPDIILENGIICELKGYMDAATRKKMLLVVKQNPDLDIRMVFQNPNTKITKSSKTTYAIWSTKNGIKWGTVGDLVLWAKEPSRK